MLTATRPVAVRQHARVSAISTERLSKRYGDTLALDSLDFVVEPGEVYGYLGPNGKTTTIAPGWLLDLTPFQHVALVPSQPFRTGAVAAMLAIAAAAAVAALQLFNRRDLMGA
jgi:ABC-type hemin transport system ATPase subunit